MHLIYYLTIVRLDKEYMMDTSMYFSFSIPDFIVSFMTCICNYHLGMIYRNQCMTFIILLQKQSLKVKFRLKKMCTFHSFFIQITCPYFFGLKTSLICFYVNTVSSKVQSSKEYVKECKYICITLYKDTLNIFKHNLKPNQSSKSLKKPS